MFAPELGWYPTSILYKQYCACLREGIKPLGYRRVAELLVELENLGLAASRAGSKGRRGYGRDYRLAQISMYESQASDASLSEEERAKWPESAGRARQWLKEFVGL